MLVMKMMCITQNDHAVLTSSNHMHACKVYLTSVLLLLLLLLTGFCCL